MKCIAFTGAHSSGKSTLIKSLIKDRHNLRISTIEGITRAIIKRGFPLEKNSTVDSYVNYIRDQFRTTRTILKGTPDVLVSDRTVLDAAAYARVNMNLPRPHIPEYFVEMLLEVALLEAKRFDLFVFCPVEFPMEEDGVRPIDEKYRMQIDSQIRSFLIEFKIPHIEASGSVSERLEKIYQAVEELHA